MVAALTNPLYQSNRRRRAFVGGPVSFADAAGAMLDEAFATNPGESLERLGKLRDARGYPNVIADDGSDIEPPQIAGTLKREDQKRRISDAGLDGRLEPVEGETDQGLSLKIKWKREEIARQSILANADRSIGTQAGLFLTGVGASVLDPVNVASAFVPAVGPAKYASMLAKQASRLGRFGVRARVGAVEGTVGAALVEPIVLGVAQQTQADYDLYDSFFNLAVGTALGGGLHGAGGFAKDVVTARVIDRLPVETRREAMASSVDAILQGRKPVLAGEVVARAVGRDPFDPRVALEADIPAAHNFDPGPVSKGKHRQYTPVGEPDRRWIEGVLSDVENAQGPERLFIERDGQGGTPDVKGVKSAFPEWFQAANRQAKRAQAERRSMTPEERNAAGPAPQSLTRKKVLSVGRKLLENKPLGRAEIGVAQEIFEAARTQRLSNVMDMLDVRSGRAAAAGEKIDAFAARDAESDAMHRQFGENADVFSDEVLAAPEPADIADDALETDIADLEAQIEIAARELGDQMDDADTKAADENLEKVRSYGNGLRRAAACIIGAFS